jgi:hypothetical protein
LRVHGDGRGVIGHAGLVLPRLLADRVDLTRWLSVAMAGTRFAPLHDRGRVIVDLACAVVAGATAIKDLAVLRDQPELFGSVASAPTVWRVLEEMDHVRLRLIQQARARVREKVWEQAEARLGGIPASKTCYGDLGQTVRVVLDAAIVVDHSDNKEWAAPTHKKTFGHFPLIAWIDNTSEMVAGMFRAGNAGANTAVDNIAVLDEALAQIPAKSRRDVLVSTDGAGATHALIDHVTALNNAAGVRVEYSFGWNLGDRERTALEAAAEADWLSALDIHGKPRPAEKAGVLELTTALRMAGELENWPVDMRVIARREKPHPGAALSLFEQANGWRIQLMVTNTPHTAPTLLEARHRVHARVEDRVKDAKNTGMRRFPSEYAAHNTAWLMTVAIATDLIAWLKLLALDRELALLAPKTLRYRILNVPARITLGQRLRHLRFPDSWPWKTQIQAAFARIIALPMTT